MIEFIRNNKAAVGVGSVVVVAGLAWLAFGYFGVHTLFIDDVVDEAAPTFDVGSPPAAPAQEVAVETPPAAVTSAPADASAADTSATTVAPAAPSAATPPPTSPPAASAEPAEPAAPQIVTEFIGTFESDAHPTAGTASVLGNGTGQRFLRFENFETDNGPDLNVYLVNSSTGDVSDYIDLGDLKGNVGDQNYEIPADVDLSVYDEVVIWCVRFGVGFGDALLMAA